MAGLTKEQREAKKLAAATAEQHELIVMVNEYPAFPGAPTEAQVHADEVDNWKAHGWKVKG